MNWFSIHEDAETELSAATITMSLSPQDSAERLLRSSSALSTRFSRTLYPTS